MQNNQLTWPKDNYENIETPWEGDLWDRRRLGEQLERYVDRLQCGAVLALDAHWGEGKTWFVRHWAKHLTDTEHNVIYLDAFANDYLDDPFLIIASEIASKLDKTADKKLVHKFKKAAAVMQQGLLTIAPTLIASMISCAITGGVVPFIKVDSEKIADKLDDAIDKLSENIGEKVTEAIQNKIESYDEQKNSLVAFKSTLSELAESLDKPLVFIIDELDRCRPDFALRLIERIKHFFDIPKIVFVLVMDKTQFSKVVCHNYGYDENLGEEYLDKFIDFSVKLKKEPIDTPRQRKELEALFSDLGFRNEKEINAYIEDIGMYVNYKKTSIRNIKKYVNEFALCYLNNVKKDPLILFFLFFKKELQQVESNVELIELMVKPLNVSDKLDVNLDLASNQFTYYGITAQMNSLGESSILSFIFGVLNVRYTKYKNYDFLDKNYESCPSHLNHKEKYYEVWKDYILNQV